MSRLFWNVDVEELDLERDADAVIARVVEHGRHVDVLWMLRRYGLERVHAFFREVGSPEVSERTVKFWRAVFRAQEEAWPTAPAWRKSSCAPWIE
jgi:hypothetical protein